jgi:hypothetical protein
LISPQLGNEIPFASQLLKAAPVLQPGNKSQITALPLGVEAQNRSLERRS